MWNVSFSSCVRYCLQQGLAGGQLHMGAATHVVSGRFHLLLLGPLQRRVCAWSLWCLCFFLVQCGGGFSLASMMGGSPGLVSHYNDDRVGV